MKHICLNLKRFDISPDKGGINRLAPMKDWAKFIIENTQDELKKYSEGEVSFSMYMPEAHLISAVQAKNSGSPINVGCQAVHRADTAVGGNFGAFTSQRTANSAVEMGCNTTIIGHCEERADKLGILNFAGINDKEFVNQILNEEIKAAQGAGLKVLYCIGETSEEQENWQDVLGKQLSTGLNGVDKSSVVIAYEPIWSIGPGKTPADKPYIEKIARFVKEQTGGMPVIYGGGLKVDNAEMLASIDEIDGGLIALTRFSGEIGFYPDEYLTIIKTYLGK